MIVGQSVTSFFGGFTFIIYIYIYICCFDMFDLFCILYATCI